MNETEIAVTLEGHEHEIGSLKHRVSDLEKQVTVIQDLGISVNRMAVSMENMLAEQKSQGERLASLESRDGKKWREVTKYVITALIGIILGCIFAKLGVS